MSRYVLLNETFCTLYAGYSNATGWFNFAITTNGEYVAAAQTVWDFPELFIGELVVPGIIIIELETTDFPTVNATP